eukprot:TRINITY_DN476_c0_g6_i1.p1 TRINITY_DN476_c0_g6~~TRINITY_DN476_c0_g6_i1.p1  ORF type:complete len:939 (+),score=220.37 TRINITY_DN476_c0_g6_i1:63-2879(+)
MTERPCTVLFATDKAEPMTLTEMKAQLENGTPEQKVKTLKTAVLTMLNGESLQPLIMNVIRFCMPMREHEVVKMVLLYWEVVDIYGPDGKLLPEMILACNYFRVYLNSHNEFVRGSALRFLSKLKEPELLEPLVPSIRSNLEHRHSYVKRNAVLTLFSVYRISDALCPDAPDVIFNFLQSESDLSCKRNAFMMLFNCAQEKAIEYMALNLEAVPSWGEMLQLVAVELIRKICKTQPADKSKYLKCAHSLLQSSSPAVQYESAVTLITLSSAKFLIQAATSTFIQLLVNESDNNVKIIVLDRLVEIKTNHPKIMQELLMDVMRALASPSIDIRKKTLEIAMDLINPRNVDEVVLLLKKEISKTQSKELEKESTEYRQLLIQTVHQCAVKFPGVAGNVVHVLMDFLGDSNAQSAADVVNFVREATDTYPNLRQSVIQKLLDLFYQIRSSKVIRSALWLVGEYSESPEEILAVIDVIKTNLGSIPFLQEDTSAEKQDAKASNAPKPAASRVLSDGTYATQVSASEVEKPSSKESYLRGLIMGGDFFLASVVMNTLVKLTLRLIPHLETPDYNRIVAECLLVGASTLRLGKSGNAGQGIDTDSYDRIILSMRILSEANEAAKHSFVADCKSAYTMTTRQRKQHQQTLVDPKEQIKKKQANEIQPDAPLSFRHLKNRRGGQIELDDDFDADLIRATGNAEVGDESAKLNRIFQLTGFSDSVYAEAYVNVHQYDIVLDVLIVNQTPDTLQNLCLELATLGDLKLCERPQNYTIGPLDSRRIKANIKVTSTETGIIFGSIVYDIAGTASHPDKNCVVLNEIHIDIMDYISPAFCTDMQFRTMWAEFEWENKVAINTNIPDMRDFLAHICKSTNMKCLTPDEVLEGDCGFLSANLYARSVFGEDALANISVERTKENKLTGYVRIRSKTQGIALSLGDKITLKQKG